MPTSDEPRGRRPRISDRVRTTHKLTLGEELSLCFGGRPIYGFAYVFVLLAMFGALLLSELRREPELTLGTKRALAQCGFALAVDVAVVVFLSCRTKTRRWLFEKDPLLVGRTISARAKWCAWLLQVALLAALVYLWSYSSR